MSTSALRDLKKSDIFPEKPMIVLKIKKLLPFFSTFGSFSMTKQS